MSDDSSSKPPTGNSYEQPSDNPADSQTTRDDKSSKFSSKGWFEKLTQAFSDEPESLKDIMEILRTAEDRNVLDADSLSIIEGAMQVTDMQVREVMIPRSQMITVRANQDPEEYLDEIIESAHSRFPVIGESTDDIKGILLAKDL